MNQRLLVRTFLAAAAALVLAACVSRQPTAPEFNAATGLHPATWLADHWGQYLKDPNSCKPCHGSTTDPAAAGGTSQVSCYGCHHPEGPAHPVGFGDVSQHGALHAIAAANLADPLALMGMKSCQTCHGADYNTPVGFTKSCFSCHTNNAPHPDKAHWVLTAVGQPNHHDVDQSNVPVCYGCHALGNNSDLKPTHPPSGTTPGCYNNTMCHGGTAF